MNQSPENAPRERWSDRVKGWMTVPAWVWHHKIYRDVWLIVITFFVWQAAQANKDRVDDIQTSRIEATANSCRKSNENTLAVNAEFTFIQTLILQGAVFPGDETLPKGEANPLKWTGMIPGPLSLSFQKQFPDFPSPDQRFKDSEHRAKALGARKVSLRDCKAELESVRAQNG